MTRVAMYPMDRKTLLHQVWLAFLLAALAMLLFAPRAHAAGREFRVLPMPPHPKLANPLVMVRNVGIGQLAVSDLDGQDERILVTPSYALKPAVSPKGGFAAFWMWSERDDTAGIWLINLLTGEIAENPVFADRGIHSFSWAPDGRHLWVSTVESIYCVDSSSGKAEKSTESGTSPSQYGSTLYHIVNKFDSSGWDEGAELHELDLETGHEVIGYYPYAHLGVVYATEQYLYWSECPKDGLDWGIYKAEIKRPTSSSGSMHVLGGTAPIAPLQSWYFTLSEDGMIYAASSYVVDTTMQLGCFRINPETREMTYLGYGYYPSTGHLYQTHRPGRPPIQLHGRPRR